MNIDNDEMETEIAKILLQNGYADERHFDECISELKELFATQRQTLRDEVVAAIGEDEPITVQIGKGSISRGTVVFRNQLRKELRTAISTIFEGKDKTNAS